MALATSIKIEAIKKPDPYPAFLFYLDKYIDFSLYNWMK
jgi:hypothetical protein